MARTQRKTAGNGEKDTLGKLCKSNVAGQANVPWIESLVLIVAILCVAC